MIVAKVGSSGACYEDWPTHYHKRAYTAVLAGMQYGVPLAIIAVAYIKIGVELLYSKRRGFFTSARNKNDETRKHKSRQISCYDCNFLCDLHASKSHGLGVDGFWWHKGSEISA